MFLFQFCLNLLNGPNCIFPSKQAIFPIHQMLSASQFFFVSIVLWTLHFPVLECTVYCLDFHFGWTVCLNYTPV